MSWERGSQVIARMINGGELQQVSGGQADGKPWLDRARRTLRTSEAIVEDDPESAYSLAYDAARFVGTALLAQQGLRPTTRGGHLAIDEALRAQFGDTFKAYRTLRIRRNELEYPAYPGELAELDEVREAISQAKRLADAADKLVTHLSFYRA